jgi:glycosyltransferase involved in cell wall biosynthesis
MNLNCNEINDFPTAPANKRGWPWTNDSAIESPVASDTKAWPKISIVTPSFNQGQFLEETIRSVLLQNYPNLEYIIIDGGSTDNSVDIIKKYSRWLSYWVSEKDNGQAHAINKGLERCTGEIFNWINSDDYLTAGALKIIAKNIENFDAVAGAVMNFDNTSEAVIQSSELYVKKMIKGDVTVIYQQPGTWVRTEKLRRLGGLKEDFHFCFDWFMLIGYLNMYPKISYVTDTLVKFRLHKESKTLKHGSEFRREILKISHELMYLEEYRLKYYSEAIKCAQRYLWIEEIDRLKVNSHSGFYKSQSILSAMVGNIFSYPYRYALGTIRNIIFGL